MRLPSEAPKALNAQVLKNRTAQRLGVVVNVDGLNVISGELDSGDGKGRMYILAPHGKARIRGWRRSLEHVHRFEFVVG